jgi:hypothetical protein
MGGLVKPEEFDCTCNASCTRSPPTADSHAASLDFHEMTIIQEIALAGARGYNDGLGAGTVIGLPPVLNFGPPALKEKVVGEMFSGKKSMSLAISEAFAGSDVNNLRCEAKKSADGKEWIINGHKKCVSPLARMGSLSPRSTDDRPCFDARSFAQVDHRRMLRILLHSAYIWVVIWTLPLTAVHPLCTSRSAARRTRASPSFSSRGRRASRPSR